MDFQTLLFYKYVTITDPQTFAQTLQGRLSHFGLKGRVIVAEEGINAILEGAVDQTEAFSRELKQDARFQDMNIKRSSTDGKTLPKLSVKVRPEIVGTHFSLAEADPRVMTAPHLPAEELHEMYQRQEDFVIVDMRNSYEFASGHFAGSIDPGMRASRDLEKAIVKLEPYKGKKIVTVCTGGVRCEKMSAYLINKGFKNVYQLENGIHTYMEKYPGQNFVGTLYTFDDRIKMDFGGEREIIGTCIKCQQKTERYVNCANYDCHLHVLVCTSCAPDKQSVFCSKKCQGIAALLSYKDRSKRRLQPLKQEYKRLKRTVFKKYQRLHWKIRLLKTR